MTRLFIREQGLLSIAIKKKRERETSQTVVNQSLKFRYPLSPHLWFHQNLVISYITLTSPYFGRRTKVNEKGIRVGI